MKNPPKRFRFLFSFRVVHAATCVALIAGCGGSSNDPPPIVVATPSISIPTGTYTSAQQVTISDTTVGSAIYYSTNGTSPTASSSRYQGAAIPVSVTSTIQAIAIFNSTESAVAASTLTIAVPPPIVVATPSISIPTGTYTSAQTVTLSDATMGSAIYYTTNGTSPTASSTQYQGPISVVVSSTIEAIAILNGGQSAVATSTLTIALPSQAAKLTFVEQPASAAVGSTLAPVQVEVEDTTGMSDTGAKNPVSLALVGGSGLAGTLTAVPQNGVATFGNLTINNAAGGLTLLATSPGVTSATSSQFAITVVAPPAAKLAFSQQPSNAITVAPVSPAIAVTIEDANGNTVTTATNPVTLALVTGTGLTGTSTATPLSGVATFSNVTINTPGNYMLSATSAGLASATSTSFAITAPVSNGTTINQSMPVSITTFAGGPLEITYNWLAVPVAIASTVFVNFVDSNGTVQYQDTVQPPTPVSQWIGPISYTHTLAVPSDAPAGKYSIVAGLQSAEGNLSLTPGTGVTSLVNDLYQIGTVVIAPTCSITTFGAVADGVTDNLAAIQQTFDYAAANDCIALIPAGKFAYKGNPTATGIAVAGTGATSVLLPLSVVNEAVVLTGSGGSISSLVIVSSASSRLSTLPSGMIWANNADHYYVENVLINGSSTTGILSDNSNSGYILNNTISHTLADSITQIMGSYNITIMGNRILNSGDDGISNNSYVGDVEPVRSIIVQGNTVESNVGGRGLEVSGGSNISFVGNYVDNLDGYTDLYIASESDFNTQSVSNITATGNAFLDGGPNQASAILYNSQGTATTITGIAISGNQFVNPKLAALQYSGDGSETGISIDKNTDYSNNPFSITSNPDAHATETGNQVLKPSAYTTPLVPAGGGCNFTGC